MRNARWRRQSGGFTLTEVLAAVVLTAVALLPVLQALVSSHVVGARTERTTLALPLAVRKAESIRAAARTSFSTNFSTSSEPLSGGYLCTVQDGQESATLKSIKVLVGYDANGDGTLAPGEVDIVLDTMIASRG